MKLINLINNDFVPLTKHDGSKTEVTSMFVGDLLSHVLGNANDGDILITVMSNINTLAVASLINLSAIIFPDNINVSEELIQKAEEEGIPMFSTTLSAKDTVIHLFNHGIR